MYTTVSEKKIIDAFVDLYRKKPFAEISVQETCVLASVSKSTFYTYYENLPILKAQIETFIYESALDIFRHWSYIGLSRRDTQKPNALCVEIFGFVYQNRTLYDALFGSYGDPLFIVKYKAMIEILQR